MMSARLYSPAHIVAIDQADSRLEAAKQFGADVTVNNTERIPARSWPPPRQCDNHGRVTVLYIPRWKWPGRLHTNR